MQQRPTYVKAHQMHPNASTSPTSAFSSSFLTWPRFVMISVVLIFLYITLFSNILGDFERPTKISQDLYVEKSSSSSASSSSSSSPSSSVVKTKKSSNEIDIITISDFNNNNDNKQDNNQKGTTQKKQKHTLPPPPTRLVRPHHADDKNAIMVEVVRSPETNPTLIELNKPYHKLRASIRAMGAATPFRVHTFFTMDCTDHSVWQAGTLEYSWEKIGQEGLLTRIISGCESAPARKVERTKRHFLSSDEVAAARRGSFYAPYASTLPSGRHYAPFNRPHSVYYWLKHADLSEEVFVMLDPDMVFMNTLPTESVRLGKPMSQVYDYMEWTDFESLQCEHCPKFRFDRRPYAVGPPWMMHMSDWVRVTPRWIQLTQELAEKYPSNWIAEMIAYSLACKVENLPHTLTYRAMVDNFDDAVVWSDVTDKLTVASSSEEQQQHGKNNSHLPSLLHYCYTLEVGEVPPDESRKFDQHMRMVQRDHTGKKPVLDWFHFSKYRVPTDWPGGKATYEHNFMECEAPLLQEFHSLGYLMQKVFGKNNLKKPPAKMKSNWKRSAQMLQLLLPEINNAMTVYKKRYCLDEKTRNLDKTLRTSHPTYFFSKWILDEWDESGETIKFHRKD